MIGVIQQEVGMQQEVDEKDEKNEKKDEKKEIEHQEVV